MDRAGQPADTYQGTLVHLDTAEVTDLSSSGSTATALVAPGRYQIQAYVATPGDDSGGTLLAVPELDLTGFRTVVMDARLGKPIEVTVPDARAGLIQAEIGFSQWFPAPAGSRPSSAGARW